MKLQNIFIIAIVLIAGIGIATASNEKLNLNKLDSINLENGYKLKVLDADARSDPRTGTIEVKKGNDVQVQTIIVGNNFFFYNDNGKLMVSGKLDVVFSGAIADMIQIKNLTQFDSNGNIIAYYPDKITLELPKNRLTKF